MTALGRAETPFFGVAQRSSEREHRKRRAVLRRALAGPQAGAWSGLGRLENLDLALVDTGF